MKIKFLIIRFSSIGDIVLTTPVVRCLKKQIKDSEIHFVTKQKHASIVDSNPYIGKVHVLKENINDLISELEKEKFDYIIDLHQNFRSNRIKTSLNVRAFSFEKLNFQKFIYTQFKINRLPDKHIVDRYLETISVFNIKNDGKGLDYFIPENDKFNVADLQENFQKGYIAFVIAGTYFTKKIPVDKIVDICNNVEFPVILLGGKNESDEGEKVVSQTTGNVLNFSGRISLNQSATLVKEANLVLTNDTGLMHIAAAFGKKILTFWGNTVPEFGMYPYQPHTLSKNMEIRNLKCRPCSKLGFEKCPKKHFRCMNEIKVEDVSKWIQKNFSF